MAKMIMEFDYYEDREEFEMAQKGGAFHSALHELDQYLRGRLKYEELPDAVHEALQAVRDRLHSEVSDVGGL